jgi:hypothetical protein
MNKLNTYVPTKELCLEMVNSSLALSKILSNTLYIWGGAGVQLRTDNASLTIPAPTLQEMLQVLRAYGATLTQDDKVTLHISNWIMTICIGDEPVRNYNIVSLEEMAIACIELMRGIGAK